MTNMTKHLDRPCVTRFEREKFGGRLGSIELTEGISRQKKKIVCVVHKLNQEWRPIKLSASQPPINLAAVHGIYFANVFRSFTRYFQDASASTTWHDHQDRVNAMSMSACEEWLAEVVKITAELFCADVAIQVIDDPDSPGTRYTVFEVNSALAAQDQITKRLEWHEKVAALRPGRPSRLRLSVVPC